MADANLLEILDRESRLDNIIVYGNIRCAIKKPEFLSDRTSVVDGFFALVDVLAFRCNDEDYFSKYSGYQDSKHIYFSKGSMVVVINDKDLIGKNVRIYGRTLKRGCTIKKQKTNNMLDGIVAFVWAKDNKGNWCIEPNKVQLFGESDAKGTVLEDYIVSLVNGTGFTFTHPESVNSMVEYKGVSNVETVEFDKITGNLEYIEEPVDLSEVPLNLVHRLESKEVSEYADAVGEAIKDLTVASKGYAADVVSYIQQEVSKEFNNEEAGVIKAVDDVSYGIVNRFIDQIGGRYNIALGPNMKVKGKDFIDDFIDSLSGSVNFRNSEDSEEGSQGNKLIVYQEIENLRKTVPLDANVLRPENVQVPVLQDYLKFASIVIGCVSGVGISNIVSNFNTANSYNDLSLSEWFWCLIKNPYLCGMMGSDLNIHDCDRIFLGFGMGYDFYNCMKYRDMLVVLDTIKNASSRSTLINKREISTSNGKYPALGTRWMSEYGHPFKKECKVAVDLLGVGDTSKEFCDKVVNRRIYVPEVLKELNKVGLIEEVNEGIILASDLRKEHVIYSELIKRGNELTGIKEEEVHSTIEKFEDDRGFNLEVLQKDGIQLVRYKAGVLSGCAGSGKTTTSDCMVMAIEDYLPRYQLRFGAPTGKAARRLAEVVGGNVKTIHSMFGLGLGGEPYLVAKNRSKWKNTDGGLYAYFLDEMAMCNTNLMYEIVEHLNKEDLVYFLGDIKQLPPIGKGSPFKALMQFLPCVELGVSKRAAANGKINYNCGLINFVSDAKVAELQKGDDFEILSCPDAEIQEKTVDMFKRYLEEYEEDDIQVVTGYQTDRYPWSTVNLNPLLQKLLRDESSEMLYMYNDQKFMKNDRVIHVKRNAYDMPRFRRTSQYGFEEVVTYGVVNGELGKIVGCLRSDKVHIRKWENNYTDEERKEMSEDMKKLIAKRENASVEIRDESELKDEGTYFVLVSVYDVDLMEDVIILYRASYKEGLSNDFARTFSGGDLKFLDLAYALTTHKMQGSQSSAIIIPLGAQGSPQFMNRNMINTMVTRASKKVGLIGSVSGKYSALTNGRRLTSVDDCEDVLSLLS